MNLGAKALGIILLVAIVACWFAVHEFGRKNSLNELKNQRLQLQDRLTQLQTNLNQERLHWYYAFRQVEEPDARAWDLAVRKVDTEIAATSNALTQAEARLDRRRASSR